MRREFTVWAPLKNNMFLHQVHPQDELWEMHKDGQGYFRIEVDNLASDARYFYRPEGEKDYPDPASPYQPEGVHGPSQLVDHSLFSWTDQDWKGLPLEEWIIYEVHVGCFTPEGNFEAIIPRLDLLKEAGINALELMPVTQFPGNRNWGYDGVYPYAVQNSYGGPEGLKKLVDACHARGMAVILDVVYNHLGPEGNYLYQFGPYFTDRYRTPWGEAINFDGEWCDGVREFFSNNALYWLEQFHVDGLRCDAVHTVYDNGAVHFWELTQNKIRALEEKRGRPFYLIAESDLNSPKVVEPPEKGGYGFSAQWLDDFHHALYVLLDKKGAERYYDFGSMHQLAKAYSDGFVHSGEWVRFRKRKHGRSSAGIPGNKFIVFNLNHDQVGNRIGGERLCMLVGMERIKLAAAAVLLSAYIPLLFMGEEYADDTPFFYFVSHSDPALIAAVREGRKSEFREFGFDQTFRDPQDEQSFIGSKIHWEKRFLGNHLLILQWHQELIRIRRMFSAFRNFDKTDLRVEVLGEEGFALLRQSGGAEERAICLFNLSEQELSYTFPAWVQEAQKILDSRENKWRTEALSGERGHAPGVQASEKFTVLPLSVVVYYSR